VTRFGVLLVAIVLAVAAPSSKTVADTNIQPQPLPPGRSVVPSGPDLVVTFFTPEGTPKVAGGHIELRMALGVKNQGNATAGIFKVAVECTVTQDPSRRRGAFPSGPFPVPFSGDGPIVEWYAYTSGPLVPRGNWYFKRKVIFPVGVRGVSVTLRAITDSCVGDELMPEYCRVKESNEGNNRSTPVPVTLP
jgi:hypothetical protein